MPTINKYKAERLMNRQGGGCYYCLKKFSDKRSKDGKIRKVTVDHIIPRSELKNLDYKEQNHCNTVLACQDCNRRKATISAELFLEGYEAVNISPYDEPSFYIAIKTRPARRWYHRYISW